MTDATSHGHAHGHDNAHDLAHDHSHDHDAAAPGPAGDPATRPVQAGFSLIEASAAGRLLPALLILTALWAAVFWALH